MPSPFEQPNLTPRQHAAVQHVQQALEEAYAVIVQVTPRCAERTLAIRKLEEAGMWAQKAVEFEGQVYIEGGQPSTKDG